MLPRPRSICLTALMAGGWLAVVVTGCTKQGEPVPTETPEFSPTPQASRPSPIDSTPIAVELVLDSPRIMLGEPLHLSFRVHNRSSETLWMSSGGDYRNRLGRPESYACTATDENGAPVASPDPGHSLGGLMWLEELPAGGHADKRLFLPNWARLSAPGRYQLTCRTTLQLTDKNDISEPDYRELPAVATASLDVTPYDRAAMGARIDELGRIMVTGEHARIDENNQKLGAIDDARAIPHYIAMLSDVGRNGSWVVDALAKFSDDAALAGIRKVMSVRAEHVTNATTPEVAAQVAASIRHSAAAALFKSPHADARDLLVSMHGDSSEAVRITVLHQLGKETTPESTALLQKMARDPAPIVANEARRYLQLRSAP